MTKTRINTRDMVYMAVCAALLAVCSWISIPVDPPYTLQTMGVFLTMGLLGGKRGTIAVLLYILLGAIGLPVFANFAGGVGILLGTTGGYIVGFVLAALIVGFLAAHGKRTVPFLCLYMVVGCAACYLLGTIWYSTLSGNGFFASLAVCVLPYLPCDMFKILLAAVLTRALDRRLAVFRK